MPDTITIRGDGLAVADIAAVARGARVRLTPDAGVRGRIEASHRFILDAVASQTAIYGVTTLFGGMADRPVRAELAAALQKAAIWQHKGATGDRLPDADVRAAMLLRANSLARGASGIRLEIIERLVTFLNAGAVPHVLEHGSIGASGDLVPLAYIAGAILGVHADYKVDLGGATMDSHAALRRLDLAPIDPAPKEGLALINGTSVCTGIAANCVARADDLLALSLVTHALLVQALGATTQSFAPFIHEHKPHPGQVAAAREMAALLAGSKMSLDETDGDRGRSGRLIQDRYSLRCLPQYFGPIVDGIAQIRAQIEREANSATDNPLIDEPNGRVYHCGNFLAQYVGVAMDQLRYYLGLLAKHLDVQIALLVAPEFNNGLPASLVGNPAREVNIGLKASQLVGNSIMPLIAFHGNSLADRFPTHAEQFNQNINSQALGSANLARRSLDLLEHYLANAMLFAVQAVELRTYALVGHFDARACLSPRTASIYEAMRTALGGSVSAQRPLLWDHDEQFLDELVARGLADVRARGPVLRAALASNGIAAPR
jgi:phenylalanine ammonia-lyase